MHERSDLLPIEPVNPRDPRPRVIDDLVFVGLKNRVVALDRSNGDIVWKWKAPKGSNYATVLLDGRDVLVGVYGYIYCLDALSGTPRWDNPLKGFGTGVTSLATVRGSSHPGAHAAAVAEAEAAAAAAAAAG